ncbi:MAG: hypothetical protein HC819_17280 [Cyclobacteriaceae bacterium]|nr:hypothetical protein [Cyclobacteriaceae bacterium]
MNIMTHTLRFVRKPMLALLSCGFLLSLFFLAACSDDDDPEPYSIPGIYAFNKAILRTELKVGLIGIPAGKDITNEISEALLNSAACSQPENAALHLKADKSLFLTCRTEDTETEAGTWSINADTTQLTFNLPSLPIGSSLPSLTLFDLDINRSSDIIEGTGKGFPINKAVISELLKTIPGGEAFISTIPADYEAQIDIDIELQKTSE